MDPVTAIAEGNGTLRRDVIPYLSDLHHAIDNGRRDAALDILDLISTSITDVANLLRDTYRAV